MSSLAIRGPKIYEERRVVENGTLIIQNGKITALEADSIQTVKNCFSFPKNYHLIPGLIDLQLHGAQGCDVMDSSLSALDTITRYLPTEGVTAFLGCTMTETDANIQQVMNVINNFFLKDHFGAELLGVHLEGPFIAPPYAGAQRVDAVIKPDIDLFSNWNKLCGGRIACVTFAPEQDEDFAFTRFLKQHHILASIGHTAADYDTALKAVEYGCQTITHLFNAMKALHHREPNAITALLLSSAVAQLIVDGYHLHPAIVRLIYQLKGKEKIALVTDAISAKGMPDGEYRLGGQNVFAKAGQVQLANGRLAGSTLSLRDAVINMMHYAQICFEEALYMATVVPAKLLNIFNKKGSLALGKDADCVILDEDYRIVMTICRGEIAYERQ